MIWHNNKEDYFSVYRSCRRPPRRLSKKDKRSGSSFLTTGFITVIQNTHLENTFRIHIRIDSTEWPKFFHEPADGPSRLICSSFRKLTYFFSISFRLSGKMVLAPYHSKALDHRTRSPGSRIVTSFCRILHILSLFEGNLVSNIIKSQSGLFISFYFQTQTVETQHYSLTIFFSIFRRAKNIEKLYLYKTKGHKNKITHDLWHLKGLMVGLMTFYHCFQIVWTNINYFEDFPKRIYGLGAA